MEVPPNNVGVHSSSGIGRTVFSLVILRRDPNQKLQQM